MVRSEQPARIVAARAMKIVRTPGLDACLAI
jgi:hypothetical protein